MRRPGTRRLPWAAVLMLLLLFGCFPSGAGTSGDTETSDAAGDVNGIPAGHEDTAPAGKCAGVIGLCVDESGQLVKDGQPYRGIGVNYFNGFSRALLDPGDKSYNYGFEVLAKYDIPFARFMAGGYWPSDNRLYMQDKDAYFELFDAFVASAEAHGIGLIPSLFWYHSNVPDLVGEPRSGWGDPDSKTIGFMREYVREVVTRYKDSPAIWAWEFGNEYNLEKDLPNAADHRPAVHPNLGTQQSRSELDDLTHEHVAAALEEFAKEVRKYDPGRLIVSGNSIPRPGAWNQREHLKFGQDTVEQFKIMLLAENPDPLDGISVHYYLTKSDRFGKPEDVDEVLEIMAGTAREAGKPLFIGEFGVGEAEEEGGLIDHELARERFADLASSIDRAGVPLAALWVYDFWGQPDWSVTGDNRRAYQLEAIRELNDKYENNQ